MLRKIVRNLIIPAGVAKEISEYGQNKIGAIDLSSEPWIRVETVRSEEQVRLLLSSLDRGEAEVIALALEQKAKLVLIDELSGRYIAESLGINISGTVGILIKAKQLGKIDAIKPYLEEMLRHGIRYSRRFIHQVLQNAGEES